MYWTKKINFLFKILIYCPFCRPHEFGRPERPQHPPPLATPLYMRYSRQTAGGGGYGLTWDGRKVCIVTDYLDLVFTGLNHLFTYEYTARQNFDRADLFAILTLWMFSSACLLSLLSQVGSQGFTRVNALYRWLHGGTGRIRKPNLSRIWNAIFRFHGTSRQACSRYRFEFWPGNQRPWLIFRIIIKVLPIWKPYNKARPFRAVYDHSKSSSDS
jgi:hypothetical protein